MCRDAHFCIDFRRSRFRSVEVAAEKESESTLDEAPTLDDTKLHESTVVAGPSDETATEASERAQPDAALRAAAELQRYCEQTAPIGMPAPDFQVGVLFKSVLSLQMQLVVSSLAQQQRWHLLLSNYFCRRLSSPS